MKKYNTLMLLEELAEEIFNNDYKQKMLNFWINSSTSPKPNPDYIYVICEQCGKYIKTKLDYNTVYYSEDEIENNQDLTEVKNDPKKLKESIKFESLANTFLDIYNNIIKQKDKNNQPLTENEKKFVYPNFKLSHGKCFIHRNDYEK